MHAGFVTDEGANFFRTPTNGFRELYIEYRVIATKITTAFGLLLTRQEPIKH